MRETLQCWAIDLQQLPRSLVQRGLSEGDFRAWLSPGAEKAELGASIGVTGESNDVRETYFTTASWQFFLGYPRGPTNFKMPWRIVTYENQICTRREKCQVAPYD
ncbi:hypothetical protein RRG08_051617 [Elysia crispata]|uniref:Uncharacterized protein n=1 Tax=Elysia crispata TaxID=231223 RepID=A0AAE1A2N6_9GAST|nr:hypothetical protein RRG08_051617 [Elysia crispata]